MFWIQNQVSHSPPSIAIFTLPLPSALAISIRTHIFPRQFLVLEMQKLEPSRTKTTGTTLVLLEIKVKMKMKMKMKVKISENK
jgi:hypothetical protein